MLLWALLAGGVSGLMIGFGKRLPLLGFVALVPVGLCMLSGSALEASVAGAVAGVLASVPSVWTRTLRKLVPLAAISGGAGWALAFALAGWLQRQQGPGFIVVSLPLGAALATLLPRLAGAPRWGSNPLACTQERWLPVVHTARLAHAGDLATSTLLALASAALSLLLVSRSLSLPLMAAGAALIAALSFGWYSLRSAAAKGTRAARVRVAAVVADGPPPQSGEVNGLWPAESPDYRDVDGTIARYQPLIERAAGEGARILVLPEVCVYLDAVSRPRWLEAVHGWARAHGVAIVAPYFNAELPRNELAVVDARGVVAEHEKQYPAPRIEPPRRQRLHVGPHRVLTAAGELQLSTAICVDLDYGVTARSARRAGRLLAAPSNDWFDGFELDHHHTAVWSAVLAGVPLVRATGHGISAIFDRAGRVLAQQSSQHGPVVLVADVELG